MPSPQQPAGAALSSLSEAQSDARTSMQQPLSSSGASDLLYIGNTGNNSITVYNHAAFGNTAPLYVISGSKTGIDVPGQLSEDAQGNLYVTNGAYGNGLRSSSPAVLVFAHGANGNVAPIRKLAGPSTGIQIPTGMTVDKTTGKIFVNSMLFVGAGASVLLRFPPGATGDEKPYAQSGYLLPAIQLAFDSTGQRVIEANSYECCSAAEAGVTTLPKQFPNGADLQSLYYIFALPPGGLADDPTTRTYVVTTTSGIYRFAENTTGHGVDGPDLPTASFLPAPVSIITNDTCGGQAAVAPGPTPYTYVVHSTLNNCSANAVYVYANNASGNVSAPVRILSGPATGLNQPYGIYEGM